MGHSERVAGLTYVALSRVRKLSDLVIEPMTFDRLRSLQKTSNYKFRLIEEERLNTLAVTMELIRVMSSKAEKRQLFLDKLAAEQPVMLSNIQMSPSGTTLFNYSTIIKDVPPHAVKFKFSPG